MIATLRQHFIKTGEFDKKWSDVYEYIMSSRHTGDGFLHDMTLSCTDFPVRYGLLTQSKIDQSLTSSQIIDKSSKGTIVEYHGYKGIYVHAHPH